MKKTDEKKPRAVYILRLVRARFLRDIYYDDYSPTSTGEWSRPKRLAGTLAVVHAGKFADF